MPKAFQPIPVPKFTLQHILLAELCAKELWNGVSYINGKKLIASDEEFLNFFSSPVFALVKNPRSRQMFTETDIRLLINAANLKAIFRTANGTDFTKGIASFKSTAFQTYSDWKNGKVQLTVEGYATKATLDWSFKFVENINSGAATGNHRVPLACRILFFALPDMLVFNYSNSLARKMQLQSRPQAALPNFNRLLNDGLILNSAVLSKLDMPKPVILADDIWTAANAGGWWKRRVLDIALLLHFGVTSATSSLQTKARQLNAQRRNSVKV